MTPPLKFVQYLKTHVSIFKQGRRAALFPPTLVIKPEGAHVLVLSPHFDDEIIGCGGTLYKHIQAGDRVSVVYLTDGTNGTPDIQDKKEAGQIRKKESVTATESLGITDLYFLDEIEGHIDTNPKTVVHLRQLIQKLHPTLIYLPWFGENHSDHRKINRIFFEGTQSMVPQCNIAAYEVWTPLPPNIIVDIGTVFEKKMEALECFKSQLKHNNYRRVVSGLNAYNSRYCLNGESYAEAFLYLPIRDYLKILTTYKNV